MRFIPSTEGMVWNAEQRERLRQASLKRESTVRRKVSIGDVVYDNVKRAEKATGISSRSIANYATHGIKPTSHRFYPETMFELCKTIHWVTP